MLKNALLEAIEIYLAKKECELILNEYYPNRINKYFYREPKFINRDPIVDKD